MLEELPREVLVPGDAQNPDGHSCAQPAVLGPSLSRMLEYVTSGVPYSICVYTVLLLLLLDHRARTGMWLQHKCQCYFGWVGNPFVDLSSNSVFRAMMLFEGSNNSSISLLHFI